MTLHRLLVSVCLLCAAAHAARADAPWIDKAQDGSARVHLYFFWSQRCPHCLGAIPFVQTLASEYPWLQATRPRALFTLVIAGLDAFNPCAFFVLLFLLNLMVHARSRARMLLIGGTFIFFSGLIYFPFMAAWLNLFLVVGGTPIVTFVAGLVAVIIGLLNTKDFFWFEQGPSLMIPESAKPGLFRRMRALLAAGNITAMLFGTATLALAANSYELLCTADFPMVYTCTLTLNELGRFQY